MVLMLSMVQIVPSTHMVPMAPMVLMYIVAPMVSFPLPQSLMAATATWGESTPSSMAAPQLGLPKLSDARRALDALSARVGAAGARETKARARFFCD